MKRFNVIAGELPNQEDRAGHAWRGRQGVMREMGLQGLGLINESTEPARVLILSTKNEPSACAYPDSGKVATPGGVFRVADEVDYWDGEAGR